MTERGRERKKRRRYSDDDDDPEGISGWKLGMVVAVIVVCFAMLYPSVFHPMLMGFLGRSPPPPAPVHHHPPHPGMAGSGGGRHPGGHSAGRPHDHPAMRMAAAQADSHSTGGKGMFTWMLPVYTVGVVVFLLYTLFKSKKKKRKGRSRYDSDSSDDEDDRSKFSGKLGKKKLRGLQERLKQTEDAMSKILEQLEAVQAAGVDVAGLEKSVEALEDESGKPVEKPAISAESEQYIGDLERALKEFKVLSAAYEEEKDRHLESEGLEGTSDEEMNSSEETADESDEEERRREKKREQRRREKERRNKKKRKEETEEDEEEEESEREEERAETTRDDKEEEARAKENIESLIGKQKSNEKANVRRRAKKI